MMSMAAEMTGFSSLANLAIRREARILFDPSNPPNRASRERGERVKRRLVGWTWMGKMYLQYLLCRLWLYQLLLGGAGG